MTEKTYNGWTNYETWLVKLWIDNEEGSSRYWADRAVEIYERFADEDDTFTKAENAAFELQDELKDQHEEAAEQSGVPTSGFVADLFNAAMSEVNWHEIATSLIEDNVDEETAVEATNGADEN